MAAKSKILKRLTNIYLLRDKASGGATTTLGAAGAVGDASIDVASATNIQDNDVLRIGSGEETEVVVVNGAPSGTTVTLESPLTKAHALGEVVVEQVAYDIGDPEAGGVSVEWAGDVVDVNVATRRLVFQRLTGFISASCSFTIPTFDLNTFAHAVGALLSKVTGAGTTADPTQFVTDGNEFTEDESMSIVAVGVTNDGTVVRAELWGVTADYSGISFGLTRGALAGVPMRFISSGGGVLASSLPAFVADTSIKPGKGKVWSKLIEAGYYVDGAATDLDGAFSAGANSIDVTSATGIAVGTWLRIGSGETAEHVQVNSIAGAPTLALRTRLLRDHADAVAVTIVTPTKFGAVGPAGVTLSVGGTVTPITAADHALNIGARGGAVDLALTFPVLGVTLENMARAMGIPQSDIASGVLPWGENISTGTIEGMYLRGVLKDGTECWVVASGCEVDVAQVALLFNNAGDPPTQPISVKPTSALLLTQAA